MVEAGILRPVSDTLSQLRAACERIAAAARQVRIDREAIPGYAAALPLDPRGPGPDPEVHLIEGSREQLAAFWLTLDAINFGSGWFPTLRKREGRSGYATIASGVRDRFTSQGAWSGDELQRIDATSIATVLDQDPDHELMERFAVSLRDLGHRVAAKPFGRFESVVDAASDSAESFVELLAGWDCFADVSDYFGLTVPFLKRAQIAAADLARAGVADFKDLDRLTIFADNVVPHVLRLDGVLHFEPALVERIDRGDLIEHGSPEEVEIRACALHGVELIVAERGWAGSKTRAAEVDQFLWLRGRGPRYKASPRHRSRCTAY